MTYDPMEEAYRLEQLFAGSRLKFTTAFEGLEPVQSFGTVEGLPFYHRQRGHVRSLTVGPWHEPSEIAGWEEEKKTDNMFHRIAYGDSLAADRRAEYLAQEAERMIAAQDYPTVPAFYSRREEPLPEEYLFGESGTVRWFAFLLEALAVTPRESNIRRSFVEFDALDPVRTVVPAPDGDPVKTDSLIMLVEKDIAHAYGNVVAVEGNQVVVDVDWGTRTTSQLLIK
jgi:hypothetical protein